jgi:hypothetical protein
VLARPAAGFRFTEPIDEEDCLLVFALDPAEAT